MANTFELINSYTVGSGGAASMTFSVIPGTYTDLCIYMSARSALGSGNWDGIYVSFNGTSTSTNHTAKRLYGTGSGATSDSSLPYASFAPVASVASFSNNEIYIPNYAGSTNKSVSVNSVTENNATAALNIMTAGLWSNTAAITSITLTTESGSNFMQYSTAYLYGVKNA